MFTTKNKIFTGNANVELSLKVAQHLKAPLGRIDVTTFSDGEVRVEIQEHVRGSNIFLIQPTCAPTNDNLMELLVMVDAFRRAFVQNITAVIPYYGYSRQDRRPDFSRTPISSRLVADMLQVAGVDQVMFIDLHSGQQQGFFNIPVVNISASPEIIADIFKHKIESSNDIVVVSPDAGGVPRARSVAKMLNNTDLAIIDKRRPDANSSEVMNIIGDVEGKHCIIVDDMIDTAGTLCKGAAALKKHGAKKITAYATHPVLSGNAMWNIEHSEIDEVVVTDTIPLPKGGVFIPDKIRVISVSQLIAETIHRISTNQSVSELYIGH